MLVIEGALYALGPHVMQRAMRAGLELPPSALRLGGIVAASSGFLLTWLVRG